MENTPEYRDLTFFVHKFVNNSHEDLRLLLLVVVH